VADMVISFLVLESRPTVGAEYIFNGKQKKKKEQKNREKKKTK
jgi:hypothetical protein